MKKIKPNPTQAFYILFAVCFTFVIINVVFNNKYHETSYLIAVTPLCIAGLCLIYKLLGRYEPFLEKNYNKILLIFTAVMFIFEMTIGLILRHDTGFDIGAVNKGAVEWVETGTFAGYYDYFYGCPNNLGPMAFFFVFFKIASFIGITDFYAVAVFLDSVMVVTSMALVSLICRKYSSSGKVGIFALVLFALSAQFWFMGAANYTDIMSMLFPVLAYWLYIKSKEYQGKRQLLMYLLAGISLAVGSLNKFTAFIMAIAIIIDMCFSEKWQRVIEFSICAIGATALLTMCFNGYIYSTHLDRDMARQNNRPYTHWVMMGLNGNGLYNPGDFQFTDGIADPDERKEKVNEEVINRIKNLGVPGIYNLIANKSAVNFGDGTYGIADCVSFDPLNNFREIRKWITHGSEHYSTYSHYVTSMHISIMLFMLIGAYALMVSKTKRRKQMLAPYLAIFGVWLFLLCWESNRRYFSNFAPIIIMCSALGMETFIRLIDKAMIKLNTAIKG